MNSGKKIKLSTHDVAPTIMKTEASKQIIIQLASPGYARQ